MAVAKTKRSGNSRPSDFVRQVVQSDCLEGILPLPAAMRHRLVEVIVLPVFEQQEASAGKTSPLTRFAGAWAGESLVREAQGDYEDREELK